VETVAMRNAAARSSRPDYGDVLSGRLNPVLPGVQYDIHVL
jgi:hypothetical protein